MAWGLPGFSSAADLWGNFWNIGSSINDQARWDKAYQEQILPANRYGEAAANALGPIGNTTRMAREMRTLASGLSDQGERDVNRRYDQLGAAAIGGLNARGIGGSTVAPSVLLGNERARGDELRAERDARINTLLGVSQSEIATNQAAADARLRFNADRYLTLPQPTARFQTAGR